MLADVQSGYLSPCNELRLNLTKEKESNQIRAQLSTSDARSSHIHGIAREYLWVLNGLSDVAKTANRIRTK